MSTFRVKREDNDEELGYSETYLTDDMEWGTEEQASTFKSREDALSALNKDEYDSTGDYQYRIERA